jgi:hypothetical protein
MRIVPDNQMLLEDRKKISEIMKAAINRLMVNAEYPVIAEQIKRLKKTVDEQERIIDEAGSEILRFDMSQHKEDPGLCRALSN